MTDDVFMTEQFWAVAPDGYDYFVIDKEGVFEPRFHKRVCDRDDRGPCYEDMSGQYWLIKSGGFIAHERPSKFIGN